MIMTYQEANNISIKDYLESFGIIGYLARSG